MTLMKVRYHYQCIVYIFLSLCRFWPCFAREEVTSTSWLNINTPVDLQKKVGYDHRDALFGNPPMGKSLTQNLYYVDSDLCDRNINSKNMGYPQREYGEDGLMLPWTSPFILMVDRGGCSFVQKVRNAQHYGAAAVLISDNKCMCSDRDCNSKFSPSECETAEPIMADDGSGSDISIPSMLLFRVDGETIKTRLKANETIMVEMSWNLPNPDDRVEYDLWTTPSDVLSMKFLLEWKRFATALGTHAYFTPHYYIYDGIKSQCFIDGENECYNLCTNNGRYCSTDPDNDLESGISGADVIAESLRRVCIWKRYGEPDGIGLQWWNYITFFERECNDPDFYSSSACITRALSFANIDERPIGQCMSDSGGLEGDSDNFFLNGAIQAENERGVIRIPSMYVNQYEVTGALKMENTFKAICSGYAKGTLPDVCNKCLGLQSLQLSHCVDSLVNENMSNETKIEQQNTTQSNSTNGKNHHGSNSSSTGSDDDYDDNDTGDSNSTMMDGNKTTSSNSTSNSTISEIVENSNNSSSTGSDYDYDDIDTGDSNSTMMNGNKTTSSNSTSNTTIGEIVENSNNSSSKGSDYDYDDIDNGDSNSTMMDGNKTTIKNGTSIDHNDGYNITKHHNSTTIINNGSHSVIIKNTTLRYNNSSVFVGKHNDNWNDNNSNIKTINDTVIHDVDSVQFTNGTDIDDIHMNVTTNATSTQKNSTGNVESDDTEKSTLSEAEIVFAALCSAHKNIDSQPKICRICLNCPTLADCVLYEKCDLGVNEDPSGN